MCFKKNFLSGHLLLFNGTVLSSNDTRTMTTDDDHVFEKRVYLILSKIKLTVADAILDCTDIKVRDNSYLHLTEAGSTVVDYKVGTYTLSYVQVYSNSSIIFDYSSVTVKNILRKRIFSTLPGIILKTTVILKISEGSKVHSNSEGYGGSDLGSDSGIDSGMGGYGVSGGGGGAYGGEGGQGFSATGISLCSVLFFCFFFASFIFVLLCFVVLLFTIVYYSIYFPTCILSLSC